MDSLILEYKKEVKSGNNETLDEKSNLSLFDQHEDPPCGTVVNNDKSDDRTHKLENNEIYIDRAEEPDNNEMDISPIERTILPSNCDFSESTLSNKSEDIQDFSLSLCTEPVHLKKKNVKDKCTKQQRGSMKRNEI